jgi:hypothetical protein
VTDWFLCFREGCLPEMKLLLVGGVLFGAAEGVGCSCCVEADWVGGGCWVGVGSGDGHGPAGPVGDEVDAAAFGD